MSQTLLDLRDNLIRNMDEGQPNTFIREAAKRLWNLALESAEQEAEAQGKESAEMHDLVTPESLAHSIAARIRKLKE